MSDKIVLPREISEGCRRVLASLVRALQTYEESSEDQNRRVAVVLFAELGAADEETQQQFLATMSSSAREMIAATIAANAAAHNATVGVGSASGHTRSGARR
jgi:hypothetical protein